MISAVIGTVQRGNHPFQRSEASRKHALEHRPVCKRFNLPSAQPPGCKCQTHTCFQQAYCNVLRQSCSLPAHLLFRNRISRFHGISVLEKLSSLQHFGIRRRPTLPGRFQPSTISVWRLNFCVRYGNRWIPPAIVTGNRMHLSNLTFTSSVCNAPCFSAFRLTSAIRVRAS